MTTRGKFTCTQENLIRGLSRVAPVAGRNAQLPILQHVLWQLRDGLLHLTCTDLEVGVHTTVAGKVDSEGVCTVPARKISEYIQQLPTTHPIVIEHGANGLRIKTKDFNAQFSVGGDDDFPSLPPTPKNEGISVDGAVLGKALARAIFSAARDDTRPEIHSVFIQGSAEKLIIAATDSFRLAEVSMPLMGGGADFSLLLPLTAAHEVVRLCSDQAEVRIVPNDTQAVFIGDSVELSSRLVDGSYPDYRQIIPTTFSTSGTVETEAFIRALKTLSVFLPRDTRRVQLAVNPAEEKLQVSVGGEAGAGDVAIAFTGTGNELQALFNIQYLIEGAHAADSKELQIQFVGAGEPAVFKPSKESEEAYTYVVMPIQA